MMAIGERIHFFRILRGMTQKYLGDVYKRQPIALISIAATTEESTPPDSAKSGIKYPGIQKNS